jgi:hypothetical protein
MTIDEGFDLFKKVERYEAALVGLRNAHEDVREVLHDNILFDRWRQLGVELGFAAQPLAKPDRDFAALSQQSSELSDAWSG